MEEKRLGVGLKTTREIGKKVKFREAENEFDFALESPTLGLVRQDIRGRHSNCYSRISEKYFFFNLIQSKHFHF